MREIEKKQKLGKMKILVCISNVPDTTAKISFVEDNKVYDKNNVQFIISPYEELALTRALELKEAASGTITVLTVGLQDAEPTMRKALAMGADDAIRVNTEAKDAMFVAKQIAEVAKNENYDIIFTGKESIDYNGSQVGEMVAELLDIPSITSVSGIDVEGTTGKIQREIDGGYEQLECEFPFVGSGQKGIAPEPRIPAMRGIMMARKKPLNVVEPVEFADLTEVVTHTLPEAKSACTMIEPDNVAELVKLLHEEAKAI